MGLFLSLLYLVPAMKCRSGYCIGNLFAGPRAS